jgi:hypothetical protein
MPLLLPVIIVVLFGGIYLLGLVVRQTKHPVLQGLIWLLVSFNVAVLLVSSALAPGSVAPLLMLLGSVILSFGIFRFVAACLQWKSVVIEEYPPHQQ